MTTYKEIFGKYVKNYSSDPSSDAEGQIWYNTTSGTFKSVVASAAWSAGSPMITARRSMSGAGTQTAGLGAGGYLAPGYSNATEEYNGSGWATSGNMNTTRITANSIFGTQTAAIAAGGETPASPFYTGATESYNGSTWTSSPNSMNTGRVGAGCAGISTAGLVFGGSNPGTVGNVESWNGTAWTATTALSTARYNLTGAGLQTAALAIAGVNTVPALSSATELWNGTSWTTLSSINTARQSLRSGGISTSAIIFGGLTPTATSAKELWNGTSWTSNPTGLATARNGMAGFGTSTQAVSGGGGTPSNTTATEEFNFSSSIITAGAWASGANYPITVQDAAGAGPITANVTWGGYDGPAYTAATNEYNGSAWTSSGNMNTARAVYQTGIGTQTAAIGTSGYVPGGGPSGSTSTESYDGSTWTNVNSLNTSRYNASATGIQTSGIITGGRNPGVLSSTEEWDGTSWTAGGSTPVSSQGKAMSGQSNTDVILIGVNTPSAYLTLLYNGTSWSDTGHNLLDFKGNVAGGSQQGTTSAAIIGGGVDNSPAIVSTSYQYNGSSWSTAPSISTARYGGAASGTYQSALAVGGEQPAQSNATEEWTGETSALNFKTITTS
jgi:hypothetical protein